MATTSSPPPSPRTLVAAAVGVPAAVVLFDQLAWMPESGLLRGNAARVLFFPWLAIKTALLAWTAGRFLGSTLYGWIVLLWTQAMLDVYTFGASKGQFSSNLDGLCHTLISAQIGFLAVWTILGVDGLPWRLTAMLTAAGCIVLQSQSLGTNWRGEAIPFLQSTAAALVAAVCIALRWSGFRLTQPDALAVAAGNPRALVFQFGVKHMLAWTTALAPLLLAARGLDLFVVRNLGLADFYPGALVSVSTALVTLATIWLTLGQGAVVLRIIGFVVAVAGASLVLQWQSEQWTAAYGWWNRSNRASGLVSLAIQMGGERLWAKWFMLISVLLAAMLLFLRAAGYRLAKMGPCEPAVEVQVGGLFD